MESISIILDNRSFKVEKALQDGVFKVSSDNKEFLVAKSETGEWVLILADSEDAGIDPQKIGAQIEAALHA